MPDNRVYHSSLATLNLYGNKIDDAGMVLLRDSWLGLFLRHPSLNGPGLILRYAYNPRELEVLFHGNAV